MHGSLKTSISKTSIYASLISVIRRIKYRTEHRYVCKHAGSIRFNGRSVGTIIGFEAVGCRFIPNLRIPQSSQKLQFTRKSVIRIEVIVPSSQRYQVFTIYRTAEPFVRIVSRVRNLYIIDCRSATHRTKRNGIDFIISRIFDTGKFATHIFQYTRVIGIVVTSMFTSDTAFDSLLSHVVFGFTQKDNTAPVTGFTFARSLCRCKYNGAFARTLGNEFASALHNQRSLRLFLSFDNYTRLDSECSPFGNINEPFQIIGVRIGQSHIGRNLVSIRTVSQIESLSTRNGIVIVLITTYYRHCRQAYKSNCFESFFHLIFLFD